MGAFWSLRVRRFGCKAGRQVARQVDLATLRLLRCGWNFRAVYTEDCGDCVKFLFSRSAAAEIPGVFVFLAAVLGL